MKTAFRTFAVLVMAGALTTTVLSQSAFAWARVSAESYAWDGMCEQYVFGGGHWISNDSFCAHAKNPAVPLDREGTSAAGTEGIDCSGYVGKAYAIKNYTEYAQYSHDFSTYSFYGANTQWFSVVSYPYYMTSFISDRKHGGQTDHMGITYKENSAGTWQTWEAYDHAHGVLINTRTRSQMDNNHDKYSDRNNWSAPPR